MTSPAVVRNQGQTSMSFFNRGSRSKVEQEELTALKHDVDKKVTAIKSNKTKQVARQRKELAQFTRVIKEQGIDGIWFLALGGIEEKSK